jgi:RNA polymerase sigma factor (sigma-70 family)
MTQPAPPEATVHVVDDDAAVRDSLLLLLQLKGLRAQGYLSADAFLSAVRADTAGCVLVDLRMPGTSGLDLQARLAQSGIELPIIIITAHGDVGAARTAFMAGAVDFLEKPLDEAALFAAIGTALERDRHRREAGEAAAALDARMSRLSRREREVMWLVGDGCPNREIAAMLGLSPRTVEIYKTRMMEKLQVRGLPDLLRILRSATRDPPRRS